MKSVKLGEIGKIITGCTPSTKKSEYYADNKYMFVGPSDIKKVMYVVSSEKNISEKAFEDYKNRFIEENSIVVDCIGSDMGNVAIVKSKCLTNQQINAITNIDEEYYNIKYIYYVLSTMKKYFHLIGTNGSTMPILNKTMFENMEVEIPKIEIQNKIAKILSKLDDKIKLNNEINNNLYEMCNVIYHQLLDDNESNIEYKTIGEIAKKVINGKTPSTKNKEYWGGNIPFITIPDMHNQVFTINTERYITKEGAKSLIPKNSISVSCIATVGLVSINDKDSQTNQQINSIVIENDYDLYYLFEFLTEQEQYMKSIAGGSTTYNINKNTFENIQVPYLNKELIIEYDKKVRPMFEKIKSNQISNDTLSQLRDILLPKLMNGEIDLDNIEI